MKNNIKILIGHRGVGKTNFLIRIKKYYEQLSKPIQTIDLDQYIEQQIGQSISDIFKVKGEDTFRSYELKYLNQIIENNTATELFISVGAGFKGPYPVDAEIIFVKRETDKLGRIFLDRPRLNNNVSAYSEFLEIFDERQQHYTASSHRRLILEEGKINNSLYEKIFLGLVKHKIGGVYTLLAGDINYIDKIISWGVDFIELRTDLWTQEQLDHLLIQIPSDKILFSFRDGKKLNSKLNIKTDWALELGPPKLKHYIISSHNNSISIAKNITQLESVKDECEVLKLAIHVKNFDQLIEGYDWYERQKTKHCFLPISDSGRWSWYRLLLKWEMSPNFFKTTVNGSTLDQPKFSEWVNTDFKFKNFAAILGDPITHSWTPNEHYNFFKKLRIPVLRVSVKEDELSLDVFYFLDKLGLIAAAVTSPLKLKINNVISDSQIESVNTIVKANDKWQTANTDAIGFEALSKQLLNHKEIVLWGGGGVVESIKKIHPDIHCYSARNSEPRSGHTSVNDPQVVVWAVGRSRHVNFPPNNWKPKLVIDLNYSEDSPGKEYALLIGAKYISGELMFKEQAKAQQTFWSTYLNGSQ